MCGIVGFIGDNYSESLPFVLSGLKSLEYRGYDSAGIAAIGTKDFLYIKRPGGVDNLAHEIEKKEQTSRFNCLIGHTRWATHGKPSKNNSHPHADNNKKIFVVHNGIIENYVEIKSRLIDEGYLFKTETDTEVIPNLIDWHYKKSGDFFQAFMSAVSELRGAYALAVINKNEPEYIYAAKLSSPLVIGVGSKENYLASDSAAFIKKTKEVIFLDDYEAAKISSTKIKIISLKNKLEIKRAQQSVDTSESMVELGEFKHFMLKEIFEASETISMSTRGRVKKDSVVLGGLSTVNQQLKYIDRITIVACGTSYYSGLVGEYFIEEIAGIPVEVQLASEFKYRQEPFSRSTAIVAISQSGETADTIAALKKVEQYGILRLGIVNVVGSSIARMTDAGVYSHAGPELSVASTKAFISQVVILLEIALFLNKNLTIKNKAILKELRALPSKVEKVLKSAVKVRKISKKYSHYKNFLFIGRGASYPLALEGALKLKEVAYVHAEGCAAGEIKHGPLAMIDKNFPTFAIITDKKLRDKTYSNIDEIKARGGPVIALAEQGDTTIGKLADDVLYIPKTLKQTQPILSALYLQLFAYYMATLKGKNVDRPRNLAKSVTVE